jgi:hypothetical protein
MSTTSDRMNGATPLLGGAGRVPPVNPAGDVPGRLPPRDPQTPVRRGGDEPEPTRRDGNPTGYDRTPVDVSRPSMRDAVHAAERQWAEAEARRRAAWNGSERGVARTEADANALHRNQGWHPAHSGIWTIRDFETTTPQRFVRVVFSDATSERGTFLARAEDLRGLDAADIQDLLALPVYEGRGAMEIVDVVVPAHMPMRESVVRPITRAQTGDVDWGYGDIVRGNQFQIMGDLDGVVFSNRRVLEGTFQ